MNPRPLSPRPRRNAFIVVSADLCRASSHPSRESALVAFRDLPGALGILEDFPRMRTFGAKGGGL